MSLVPIVSATSPLFGPPPKYNSFIETCFTALSQLYGNTLAPLLSEQDCFNLTEERERVCRAKIHEINEKIRNHFKLCEHLYLSENSTMSPSPEEQLLRPIRHNKFSFSYICLERIADIYWKGIHPLKSSLKSREISPLERESGLGRIEKQNREIEKINELWGYFRKLEENRPESLTFVCLEEISLIHWQKIAPLVMWIKNNQISEETYRKTRERLAHEIDRINQVSAHLRFLEHRKPRINPIEILRNKNKEALNLMKEAEQHISLARQRLQDPRISLEEMEIEREILLQGEQLMIEMQDEVERVDEPRPKGRGMLWEGFRTPPKFGSE